MALIIESLVKMTVVIALALAVMPLLRRRSAALRHWVLIVAVACAAAQPLLTLMAPRWTLPSGELLPSSTRFTSDTSIVLLDVDAGATGAVGPSQPMANPSSASNRLGWMLFGVWLSGTLVSVGALLTGMCRLVRMTSRSRAATAQWLAATADVGDTLGLRVPARTLITEHPALLVTWGGRRPIVLLPRDAASWAPDRIRAVVSHELAHVQRKDWPTQLAAEVLRSCVWFHPLLWIACARLRQESERACDDLVLALGIERTSYATHLVALARAFKAHGRPWLPAPAIARPSTLQWRIRAMLNMNLDRRPVSLSMRAAILVAMLCASLSIAGLHAQTTSVTGTLHDTSGRMLPNATVRLAHTQSDAKYDMQSDENGRFQFTAVAPGDYVLSVRLAGFSPIVDTIALAPDGSVRREMTLNVASLRETIAVRGGGPGERKGRRGPQEATNVTQPTCTPSSVGGQIVPPTKIRNVPPQYPQGLQDANVTGTVILVAHIGADGIVNDVRPFSGDPRSEGLEEAAIIAVKQWRFTPTLLNCQPIEVQMLATVTFSMTP